MSNVCAALPPVRGSLTHEAPLKDLVWFRTGGPAEWLFRPADIDELATCLAAKPGGAVVCLGAGSITAWAHKLATALAAREGKT